MKEFVLKINKSDEASLGNIRCMNGILAAINGEHIWLRGINEVMAADIKIKQLPVKNTFLVDELNRLFMPEGLTPVAELNTMDWLSISSFVAIEAPVSALPGHTKEMVTIKLIPSVKEKKGDALLTNLAIWKAYAETASAARLAFLKFSVSENNEFLITGNPLPPLPGKEYWLQKNVLLPCGYEFEIPLAAEFINERLSPENDVLIVFDIEGNWQKIEHTFFVQARRSAVRLTKENIVIK